MPQTKLYTVSFPSGASGNTFTSAITLNETYDAAYFHRTTMASVATVYLQASADGSNFYRVLYEQIGEHPVQSAVSHIFAFDTSVSGYWAFMPSHFNYIRFEQASLCTDAVSCSILATKLR